MKFTRMMVNMMNELRKNGIECNTNGVGFYTSNGYYVEVSSVINIYRSNELEASYKTKKSAMNFITFSL